jgi:TPR repeat protein
VLIEPVLMDDAPKRVSRCFRPERRLSALPPDIAAAQPNPGWIGFTLPQDAAELANWLWHAAKLGDARAQTKLGFAYGTGHGVTQNYAEAAKWYRLAAEQGDAPAQFNLGCVYAEGKGVEQNYVKAHMWLNLATAQGNQAAAKKRVLVVQSMTRAQLTEAQKLAREWTSKSTPRARPLIGSQPAPHERA